MGIRFTFLIGGAFLAYGALLFHMYDLQIAKGDAFLARASSSLWPMRRANTCSSADVTHEHAAAARGRERP